MPNNFYNSCPKELDFHPDSECDLGKKSICDWWINSSEHHYCFWSYIRDNSKSDGSMKEHLQSELSRLMGMPSSKLNIAIEEAEEELQFILLASKYNSDPLQEDTVDSSNSKKRKMRILISLII